MSEYQRLTGNVGTRELYDYSYSNDSILSNAPEVEIWNGENETKYGKPADIYSLGLVLFFMLTGQDLAGLVAKLTPEDVYCSNTICFIPIALNSTEQRI